MNESFFDEMYLKRRPFFASPPLPLPYPPPLQRLDLLVVLGFGLSSGERDPDEFVTAAQAVIEFASRDSGQPQRDILLFGHSMGGAIAIRTASLVRPKRLILHNPLDALANVMVDGCVMTGFFTGTSKALGSWLTSVSQLLSLTMYIQFKAVPK